VNTAYLPVILTGLSLIAVRAVAAELADVSSQYDFIKIDYPDSVAGSPLGINARRQVVGYFTDKKGVDHGYLWEKGKFVQVIDYPGGTGSAAGGINDRGDISGIWFDKIGYEHGFLLASPQVCADKGPAQCPPVFTSIDEPDAVQNGTVSFEFGRGLGTVSTGINNHRQVVGMFCTAKLFSDAFIYAADAGKYRAIDNPYAAHTPGFGSKAFGINDRGVVAGDYLEHAPKPFFEYTHAFLFDHGYYTSLDVPNSTKGGFGTQVNGVNNAKVAIGVFTTPKGFFRGFIWQRGQFSVLSFPGEPYTEINGINSRGDLTGDYAVDQDGTNLLGYLAFRKTE
jgi:probable HAF family extracellular repeat protein